MRIIAKNPTAKHNYFIEDTIETGIVLTGTEIKSIRNGKVNLKDSYAIIKDNELYIINLHISPYEQGNIFNKDPLRTRKLLIHKKEIYKLIGYTKQKGLSLIPICLYFNKKNIVKVELGICKGKKLYDKRKEIAKKEANLYIRRHLSVWLSVTMNVNDELLTLATCKLSIKIYTKEKNKEMKIIHLFVYYILKLFTIFSISAFTIS